MDGVARKEPSYAAIFNTQTPLDRLTKYSIKTNIHQKNATFPFTLAF